MRRLILFSVFIISFTCSFAKSKYINITTDHLQLSYQVKDDGRLYQIYMGERLCNTGVNLLDMPRTSLTTNNIKGNEAYPVMGTEDYYELALEILHSDGNPTSILKFVAAEQNGNETVIHLKDDIYPLSVDLHYQVYPTDDIIRTWTEISHKEKENVCLRRYASSMLYFEAKNYWLRQFCGDWGKEMGLVDSKLEYGKKILDSRLGTRAAMYTQPFFEIGLGNNITENNGNVVMGTIGWTGNFRFTFEIDHDNELRVISGINPDASAYNLKKGEIFSTPDFVFTISKNGEGEGSRKFQRWMLNNRLHNGNGDRMTLLNNWENTSFKFDEDKLSYIINEAKYLGVDLFLLDDGWFGNKYPRNNDRQGLGDWQTNKNKLPDGIPFLVKTAKAKGLNFGIWIEPEMVNPKSELAEKHQDWLIRLPDRDTYYLRHQLVLDLANPKVQDFVFGVVDKLMKENPSLKYFKWDCNSPMTNVFSEYEKHKQGNLYVDYVRGLYKILQRVRLKYPDIVMMLCASGGSRCDVEALKYFDEYWVSDDTDPVERLYIQWGCSHFLPSKAMCSHVTNWNRTSSIKFRTDVAMMCKLGFDIPLNNLSQEDLDYCKQAVGEFNRLKPIIFSPILYRLESPYESNHCVMERTNNDKTHALIFAYDIHPRFHEPILPTLLEGLDTESNYRVKEICMQKNQKVLPFNDKVFTGEYLMKIGLKICTDKNQTSHIIEITKE